MKEAIKIACQYGYPVDIKGSIYSDDILNPLFWQSLGKALGWDEIIDYESWFTKLSSIEMEYWNGKYIWRYYADMYFDLLMAGRDTGKFWQDLLK